MLLVVHNMLLTLLYFTLYLGCFLELDLVDHHERILTKFVDIVGEIIASLAKNVNEVDWDQVGSTGATFIGDVIKNTSTMHKVLSVQLPPEQVQEIFSRIFELLNRQVPEYFANVKPVTPAGEQRVLDEIMHLSQSLERLRGVKAANLNLEGHFRQRFLNAR